MKEKILWKGRPSHYINLKFYVIAIVSLLIFFCGDLVPVKEMGQAKTSIAQAEFAYADMYAPEKYKQARDTLFASHDLISKGDYKDAKEKAKEAEVLAKKAFERAAPRLAEQTKKEAKMLLGKAKERYAEQFTQAEYKNVQDLIASGDRKFNEGKPMEAYADYEKARFKAKMARNISESEPLTQEEKQAERFAIWKSDSDKILAVVNKLFLYTPRSSDLEIQAKARKKLFEKTLKNINKNLSENIKLQVVRLKEISGPSKELTTYGEKYKSRLQKKYKLRLMKKYGKPDLQKWASSELVFGEKWWDIVSSLVKISYLSPSGMAALEPQGIEFIKYFSMYDRIIKSKLAACKKCYSKSYFTLSFELPQPSDSGYSTEDYESYTSKLLISTEYDDDYGRSTTTAKDIEIYAYLESKYAAELTALKKDALYALHGKLYHVGCNSYGSKITLRFALKGLKSIKIIK